MGDSPDLSRLRTELMMKQIVTTLAMVTMLAACSEGKTGQTTLADPLDFRLLDDGSKVASFTLDQTTGSARCWPSDENFDCIFVSVSGSSPVWRSWLVRDSVLPRPYNLFLPAGGYSCSLVDLGILMKSEEVQGAVASSIEQTERADRFSPWSRQRVRRFACAARHNSATSL